MSKLKTVKHDKALKFGPPVERPRAEKWMPRKGEVRVFVLQKYVKSEFGTSALVMDRESQDHYFLPSHRVLDDMVGTGLKPGTVMQIKCTRKGSRREGDFYDYEVRLAK